MLELGPYGSMRGARSNARPYRDPRSFASLQSRVKIHQRTLLPESGQTRARLDCPLCANRVIRCDAVNFVR
jgi:hypothetical protein